MKVQPELIRRAEETVETDSRVGADAAPLQNDVVHSGRSRLASS
jgi:hypothetical protein